MRNATTDTGNRVAVSGDVYQPLSADSTDLPWATPLPKLLHLTPKIFTTAWVAMAVIAMIVRRRFRFWAHDEHEDEDREGQ